jgi:hypothetical protein
MLACCLDFRSIEVAVEPPLRAVCTSKEGRPWPLKGTDAAERRENKRGRYGVWDKHALPQPIQEEVDRIDRHYRDVLVEPFAGSAAGGGDGDFGPWLAMRCHLGPGDRCASNTGCRTARPSRPWPPWSWPPQPDHHRHPRYTQPPSPARDRGGAQDHQPAHQPSLKPAKSRTSVTSHVPDDKSSSAGRLGCLAKTSPATEVIRLRTPAAWLIHRPLPEPAQPAVISPFLRIRQSVGLGRERTRLPERLSHDQSW